MSDQGYSPFPDGIEPPDPAAELAAQEALVAGVSSAATQTATLTPIGRTYAFDLETRRFTPEGRQPLTLRGSDALRLNIEKALRTERGAADVHTDQYGLEGADDLIEGQAFEASEFAEYEQRVQDALLALPYVLALDNFDVDYTPGDDAVYVSMRVVAVGTGGSSVVLDFDQLAIPIT